MKRILFIGLWLLLITGRSFSQNQDVDSLVNALETQKLTSDKQLELYEEISKLYSGFDLVKCIEYTNKGLKLAERKKDRKKISVFCRFLGVAYSGKSSLDTAYIYLEKALDYALETKETELQMITYVSLANWFRLKNDYQESLAYYMKALSLHDISVNATRADILNNIAIIHRILNNTDRAVYYFEQALDIAKQLNLDKLKMEAIYGLGTTFADKADYTKAEEFFGKVLETSRRINSKSYEIISLNSLATCFLINKDFSNALIHAQEGLKVAEELGNSRHILGGYGTLADIYREMGEFKECEKYALKAWAIDSTSVEEASYTAYTLTLANIYLGKKEKAEYYLNKYYEIMKTGNEKSLHNSLAEMEVKYESEKREMRIVSLERERQLYIWLGVAGIMLAIALGIVLYQKIKNIQKEKQLLAIHSVLYGEMRERERLARDLHDRLSGNLSAVKIALNNTNGSVENIQYKLDSCIDEIRRIAHNLMPASLKSGLKAALEDFTAQFPNVYFHFFGEEHPLEERKAFVIYCCATELITNSLRHSGATNINVQLVQSIKYISLTVQDDGSGFDEESVKKGIGLKNIYDRINSFKGKIDIDSSPGKGTETTIELKT